jgi:hypothetical protein
MSRPAKEIRKMRGIWAIAINTIKQALRLKIAVVFIILLLVLLPVMGIAMTGDGTLKGRLQVFVSYGMSLTSFLLCFLTMIVAAYSLTSDIKEKQIYTVLTKPVRRVELLLGKLLGVMMLSSVLLVLFSAIIYSITIFIPKFSKTSESERAQAENEFYTARESLFQTDFDVSSDVNESYGKLERAGQLPTGLSRQAIIDNLTRSKRYEKRAVGVGEEVVWEFNNVKPLDPNQTLFVRFKYEVSVNPPDLQIYSRWVVGDIRQFGHNTIQTPVYSFDRKDLVRTSYEIQVPADAVASDGYLAVAFLNVPLNNTVVIFPFEDGLTVLYKASTFTRNFAKAVLLILFRLIFLACLGLLTASFLSFPVAMLFCLMIFFTGIISGFILESFTFLSENISKIYIYTLQPVVELLPRFDKYNPSEYLVSASLIKLTALAKTACGLVCIRGFLALIAALLIFSYREIAKDVV